jgi:outer membrane protein OmpA-like peptidoglycan-associated protein
MRKPAVTIAFLCVASLGLAACTAPDGTPDRRATGAALGALGGAAVGQAVGRDSRGTLIGGAAGAVLGGVIGAELDRQAAELERQLAGTGAEVINTGQEIVVRVPEAITFDFGSAALRPQFRAPLFDVARSLNAYPNTDVVVIGHTDDVGSRAVNQRLSEQRAAAVRSVLIEGGVASGRIVTVGRAFDQPIATNATAEGRAANRRVEIVIRPRPAA